MASSSVTLHPRPPPSSQQAQLSTANPLPQLLHTPSGLAVLELQGTINFPGSDGGDSAADPVSIGRLDFPDYNPNALNPSSTAWMKRVYLYVGKHQRLTGEVKKLGRPLAVVRRKADGQEGPPGGEEGEGMAEELQVVEIVKYKLVFSQRPEPVGTAAAVG